MEYNTRHRVQNATLPFMSRHPTLVPSSKLAAMLTAPDHRQRRLPPSLFVGGHARGDIDRPQRQPHLRRSPQALRSRPPRTRRESPASVPFGAPERRPGPLARIYLARIALRRDRPTVARDELKKRASADKKSGLSQLKDYYLGLAQARLGDHRRARQLLEPLLDRADAATRPALLAALGTSTQALGDHIAALRYLDRLDQQTSRATERAYARKQMGEILDQLQPAQLSAVYKQQRSDSLLLAMAGVRLLQRARAAGKTGEANRIRERTAAALKAHGVTIPPAAGSARCRGIGLLLPLSGRFRAAGQLALAGAATGSNAFAPATPSITVVIRDSSGDAGAAATELIDKQAICALAGTLASAASTAVSRVAAARRVPFLTLATRPTARGSTTYRLLPDNAARVTALAQRIAAERRPRRVAILAPDNRFGRAMAEIFRKTITQQGATTIRTVSYNVGATSFADPTKRVAALAPDVVFIPDRASRLALIAPALAHAGLWPTPSGGTPLKGRAIGLAATADGVSATLVSRAGRYLQGALLAPGYYPDDKSAGSGVLVRRFLQQAGHPPSLLEAFAHDAIHTLRQQLQHGASDHASILAALKQRPVEGLTGAVKFAKTGGRLGAALLYRVNGSRIESVEGTAK